MTIQVELGPETEARLAAEALARGIPLEKAAESLLHEALASRTLPEKILSAEGFHAMLKAIAEGSEKLPACRPKVLPVKAITKAATR